MSWGTGPLSIIVSYQTAWLLFSCELLLYLLLVYTIYKIGYPHYLQDVLLPVLFINASDINYSKYPLLVEKSGFTGRGAHLGLLLRLARSVLTSHCRCATTGPSPSTRSAHLHLSISSDWCPRLPRVSIEHRRAILPNCSPSLHFPDFPSAGTV